jgi:hypothetical protein
MKKFLKSRTTPGEVRFRFGRTLLDVSGEKTLSHHTSANGQFIPFTKVRKIGQIHGQGTHQSKLPLGAKVVNAGY